MIVAGSWIEGLYIATHISQETFENKEMIKILQSQKEPLVKLVELLGKVEGEPNLSEISNDLQPLYKIYTSVDENSLSEEQMNNIRKEIEIVRAKVVKP